MRKRLILIILLIIVLAVILLLFTELFLMGKVKNAELDSAAWSSGGGMTGGHRSAELKRDGGRAVLVIESREWHNSDLTRVTYTLGEEVLDELKTLIIKARVPILSKRSYSKTFALDGDTSTFRCSFSSGSYYSVSSQQRMLPSENDRFYALRDYLYSLASGEGVTEIIPGDQVKN